jgi:hypothetical protein
VGWGEGGVVREFCVLRRSRGSFFHVGAGNTSAVGIYPENNVFLVPKLLHVSELRTWKQNII